MSHDSRYYLFVPPVNVVGPHSFDQLREWVAVGALSVDSQICLAGTDQWILLSSLPECDCATPAIQQRIAERQSRLRAKWHTEPVTPKQLKRLDCFGLAFDVNGLSKARASELISCFEDICPGAGDAYEMDPLREQRQQDHAINLLLLDDMVNNEDVLEFPQYTKVPQADLSRLLAHLQLHLPKWNEMTRFELADYVASNFR